MRPVSEGGVEGVGPDRAPSGRPSFLRRMLGESAVYGLGGVANQALAIILIPLYARALGAENYGVVAIINTTLSVTMMLVTLALPQAFFRAYLLQADTGRERAIALRTALGLRLVVSTVGLALFSILSVPLAAVLLRPEDGWHLLALVGPIVFLDSLNLVPLSMLRAERRPGPYAAISFSRAALGALLIVVFVVVLDLGILGVVLGSLTSALVTAVAGLALLARGRGLAIGLDRALARRMLAFSLPLVPAAVAGWTLNFSDRYILLAFEGAETVGRYSAGYSVGLAINALAVAPFSLAWGATYWEIAKHDDARATIARVLTAFLALACFGALGLAALATDVFRILLTPPFEPGRFIVPFSAFGYVLYGVYTILGTGLNLEGQTRRVPFIVGGVAVVNVALNLVLVPAIGFVGAGVATLLGYGLLALVTGLVSQRVYPVPWDVARAVTILLIAVGLAAAALLGPDHVAWRLGCIAAYPLLVVGLRLVPLSTASALAATLRRRRR